ncbi:MAG: Sec-independent protein translocase protein TatB [Halofilum sp. (in: g-proteobacteria)]|nr:Sec-independent protein translocase protein TatB [Halofilum sp. (in: g-proteobacteria)]
MFDIGFWELLLIGAVGLLVIGPERLPTVATLAGQWVGRIRRYARHMQSEIRDELESEHLKQVLDQQNREMQSLREEMGDARRQADELLNESAKGGRGDAGGASASSDQGKQRDRDNDD